MSRILLFIFCVLEVNRMIRGHPNHQQTIGRAVTSQSRDESGLVRDIPSLDDENKDAGADVADRDADKSGDTENKHSSRQSIENSSQSALDPLIQLQNNVNNNNNNTEDAQNKSQDYSNELISFFNKENFKNLNRRDNDSDLDTQTAILPEQLFSRIFNKTKNNRFVPVIPPKCEGDLFCDYAPDYPEDVVREQIEKKSYLKQFATLEKPTAVIQRVSFFGNENLCESREISYYPKIGSTTEGERKYILQSPDLRQRLNGEECINPDQPCSEILPTETKNFNTTCVQKYISLPFVCLSHKGEGERDWFSIKSSCCCYFN